MKKAHPLAQANAVRMISGLQSSSIMARTLLVLVVLGCTVLMASPLAAQSGTKVTASNGQDGDNFGVSVSLDADIAVIGAENVTDAGIEKGAAYVFREANGVWALEARLVASDPGDEGDRFGHDVSVSGFRVLIGANRQSSPRTSDRQSREPLEQERGAAYVFLRTENGWVEEAKLIGSQTGDGDRFGQAVALDGDVALVSADRGNEERGEAYIFRRTQNGWVEEARLSVSGGQAGDDFGEAVALEEDVAVVTAEDEDDKGAAYVFRRATSGWVQEARLTASDGVSGDFFGQSVALFDDRLLIGAEQHSGGQGAAYVFRRTESGWVQEAKLVAADGGPGDNLGKAVALSGDVALVSADDDDDNRGAAYVFRRMENAWVQESRLVAPERIPGADFGESVALQGVRALIGAENDTGPVVNSGAAYAFNICSSDVFTYVGDGIGDVFADPASWQGGVLPADDGTVFLPLKADTYTVIPEARTYGAMDVEGDVSITLAGNEGRLRLSAPCSDALRVLGRETLSGPGSRLELQEDLEVQGDVVVGANASSFANLELAGSILTGDVPLAAQLGMGGSTSEVRLSSQAQWRTPLADVFQGKGDLILEEASTMEVFQLYVGEEPGEAIVDLLGTSELRVDSLFGGTRHEGLLLIEDSVVRTDWLETGIGGPFNIEITGDGELEVAEAFIGRRDTSLVRVDTTGILSFTGGITVGDAPGSQGTVQVFGNLVPFDKSLVLGDEGEGALLMEKSGASLGTIDFLILGLGPTGVGRLVVRGDRDGSDEGDSKLAISSTLDVGVLGEASVELDSARVSVETLTQLDSGGTVDLRGTSSLESKTVLVNTGEINIRDESALIAEDLDMAVAEGDLARLEVHRGATLDVSGIGIGGEGDASVRIRAGGRLAPDPSRFVVIGQSARGIGSLVVEGDSSTATQELVSSTVIVGQEGGGQLDLVSGSATVSLISLGGFLGSGNGQGSLRLLGTSDLEVGALFVGGSNQGEVRVSNASALQAQTIVIADSGAVGVLIVEGGGSGVVDVQTLCVGCDDGLGLLSVETGGIVLANVLQVGSTGTVQGNVVAVQTTSPPPAATRARTLEQGRITTGSLFLAQGSTLDVDTLLVGDGTLGGTITWPTAFTNRGALSPGDSVGGIGTFTIADAYTQTAEGTLVVDVSGGDPAAAHDVLAIAGTASLDGALRVNLVPGDGSEVRPGDTFTIVTAGARTGTFAEVITADTVDVALAYSDTSVELTVTAIRVANEPQVEIPTAFALGPNYPNPFHGNTTIRYALPEPTMVRLVVYDVLGRRVRTLVDGPQAPGWHDVAFEAGDLASGSYVLRLDAGSYRATRSMVVQK